MSQWNQKNECLQPAHTLAKLSQRDCVGVSMTRTILAFTKLTLFLVPLYTVSQKKSLLYICDNLVRHHQILSILERNILQGIWNKHIYPAHHISILYVRTLPCKNQQWFLQHTVLSAQYVSFLRQCSSDRDKWRLTLVVRYGRTEGIFPSLFLRHITSDCIVNANDFFLSWFVVDQQHMRSKVVHDHLGCKQHTAHAGKLQTEIKVLH